MKKIFTIAVVAFLFPSICLAVNWKRVEMDGKDAAKGDKVSVLYVTGLPEIDHSTRCFQYSVWLEFEDNDVVLKRNMIDQKKGKGVEEVEIMRFKYSDIKDLLFGYDVAYASQMNELPTAQKQICNSQNLTTFLQMPGGAPVAIMFMQGGKPVSFIVRASNEDALRLYRGLADMAHLKVKTPLVYKGIVKVRAPLEPPPPESER